MDYIAITSIEPEHYGSAVSPPIASVVNTALSDFVKIEGVPVFATDNLVDTPSHLYDNDPDPLFHSHIGQVIDSLKYSFLTILGSPCVVVGDKHIAEDTRIVTANQTFVSIS